jgi:hypothetical protein
MLKGKISTVTADRATVVFDDGQTISVAVSDIEGVVKVGSEISILIAAIGSEDAGRTKIAQGLLNELLKG